MYWFLLLTLTNYTLMMGGPFETREMCEAHKINVLLDMDASTYGAFVHKFKCELGSMKEKNDWSVWRDHG